MAAVGTIFYVFGPNISSEEQRADALCDCVRSQSSRKRNIFFIFYGQIIVNSHVVMLAELNKIFICCVHITDFDNEWALCNIDYRILRRLIIYITDHG